MNTIKAVAAVVLFPFLLLAGVIFALFNQVRDLKGQLARKDAAEDFDEAKDAAEEAAQDAKKDEKKLRADYADYKQRLAEYARKSGRLPDDTE